MKLTRKIMSIILTVMLVLSCIPMSAISVSAEEAVTDLTATIDTGTRVTLKDTNGDGYYEIGNANDLYAFSAIVNGGNTAINAILTDDIVVNEGAITEDATDVRVWTPIGNNNNMYNGIFDGNNKTVSGLYYNNSVINNVGLFGYTYENSEIKNLTIENSYFSANNYVGCIVGKSSGKVTNCHNKSTILGKDYIGGVAGNAEYSEITNCYNIGKVNGNTYVGGITGYNNYGYTVNSYNEGTVNGTNRVGGVVGNSSSTVEKCYNTGAINGNKYVGGVVGICGNLINCYNTGTVSGTANVGGIVAVNDMGAIINCYNTGKINAEIYLGAISGTDDRGTVTNSYYLNTSCSSGTGKKDVTGSVEAKTSEQFASGEVAYLLGEAFGQEIGVEKFPVLDGMTVYKVEKDNGDITYINKEEIIEHKYDSNGFCTVCESCYQPATDSNEDGYFEIDNAGKLYWFAQQVNNGNNSIKAILTADITVNNGTITASSTNARVWTPIGNEENKYSGIFNGNNKTVSGLYFNDSSADYVGLFGYTDENSEMKNISVENSYFFGDDWIGGLVGHNSGKITNCHTTSTVNGNLSVGGIVGYNNNTISNSYNTGSVNGDLFVGGLAGENCGGTIMNSYNTGTVNGKYDCVGGIVGENSNGTVTTCYNTGSINGNGNVGGVVGYSGTVTQSYYLDTAYNGGFNGVDVPLSAEPKTAEQFASGAVTYLLGDAYGQEIGVEKFPVLGGKKVYQIKYSYGYIVYTNTYTGHDHVYETVKGYDATCTKKGLTDGEICSCGHIKTPQAVIPAKGHNYNSYSYCNVCGEDNPIYNEPIGNIFYFKPCSNWYNDGARFVAYVWTGNSEDFIDLYDTDGDGYFEFTNDDEWENVIFCRLSSSASTNWDNVWNQTDDLVIPTDGNNCYTLAEGSWSNGNGTWSQHGTPVTYDMGDIDLDGILTIRDASLLSKYLVACETLTSTQLNVADVNGDGYINVNDVTHIQKMLAELV